MKCELIFNEQSLNCSEQNLRNLNGRKGGNMIVTYYGFTILDLLLSLLGEQS